MELWDPTEITGFLVHLVVLCFIYGGRSGASQNYVKHPVNQTKTLNIYRKKTTGGVSYLRVKIDGTAVEQ